jgi:pyrroline-5-carboxylate reductase
MPKHRKIAIIGGGNLGLAIANGLIKSNYVAPTYLWITRRKIHLLESLKKQGVNVLIENKEAVKSSDIIIVAVKPHQIPDLFKDLKDVLDTSRHIVVSVATGIEIKRIQQIVPGLCVFRAKPNTAIALQQSMTCIATNGSTEEQEKEVIEIFNQLGKTLVINEELMAAATVIGACGIAFALRFMRAMSQGGIEIGFGSEVSQLITAQTIKGAAQLILESGNHPEEEIDKVTTPMGITISGLNEMEHQGFSPSVIRGLLASYNKIEKMKKG